MLTRGHKHARPVDLCPLGDYAVHDIRHRRPRANPNDLPRSAARSRTSRRYPLTLSFAPTCLSTAANAARRLAASTAGRTGSSIDVGSCFPAVKGCDGGTNSGGQQRPAQRSGWAHLLLLHRHSSRSSAQRDLGRVEHGSRGHLRQKSGAGGSQATTRVAQATRLRVAERGDTVYLVDL